MGMKTRGSGVVVLVIHSVFMEGREDVSVVAYSGRLGRLIPIKLVEYLLLDTYLL